MRSRAIVVGAICGAAVVTGGWFVQRGLVGSENEYAGVRLFDQVRQHIVENYVEAVSDSVLYQRAVTGLLDELNDPNSVYLSGERLAKLDERTSGLYVGLGVRFDVRDGWITVIAAHRSSPAERAGLTTGDRILEIDGVSTHDMTPDEASRALRGKPGTTALLLVQRGADGQQVKLSVARREVHVQAVSRVALLDGGVGYVDVNVFGDSTAAELARTVDSLRTLEVRGLVMDLRRNPGGLLQQGVEVADLFLNEGQRIVDVRGRTTEASAVFEDQLPQRWSGMPVVVLVDEGTASAAEIVAGALQDHDRAIIVGRTTFGKGSAQSLFPLVGGGALKLTTARWYTPAGRAIGRPFGAQAEEEEQPLESAAPEDSREQFRTDSGRITFGGGGITPDLVVGDTLLPPAELALGRALGNQVTTFRDVITNYALELRGDRSIQSRDFAVTGAMREAVYAKLRARGVEIPREVFDGATPLVDRLLAQDVVRFVFDPEASVRRSMQWDRALQTAVGLLRGVATPAELLERAAGGAPVIAAARRAAVAPVTASAPVTAAGVRERPAPAAAKRRAGDASSTTPHAAGSAGNSNR
ncbi:MAG: S41 family peptidase [Gemmatimonadaceae bacterium]